MHADLKVIGSEHAEFQKASHKLVRIEQSGSSGVALLPQSIGSWYSAGPFGRDTLNRISVLFLVTTLASCQAIPGEGPLAGAILSDSGKSVEELHRDSATVYQVVNVDSKSADTILSYTNATLTRRFGFGGRQGSATIGVGDRLLVSIFEAGADGLFSTSKSKTAKITVVVQPDGQASIPYVGEAKFAGLTLEQARQEILQSLKGKAVEPDVIVSNLDTASRDAVVTGAVKNASVVPLSLAGERLTDVIAKAGGPSGETYDTFVTVTRRNRSATVPMSSLINTPSENIWVQPGDEITLVDNPRQFTVLGAVKKNRRQRFGSREVSLIEAVGMSGGSKDFATDETGFFVFRYEEPEIAKTLMGSAQYEAMLGKGMRPDTSGRVPLVYRFDMSRPDSLLAGQKFPVKTRDVIYVSRHQSTDISKFFGIIGQPLRVANTGATAIHRAVDMND